MDTNIYSTIDYLKISEEFSSNIMQIELVENIQVVGLRDINNFLNFGMYAPFWQPNFLVGERSLNELDEIIANLLVFKDKKRLSAIQIKLPPPIYSTSIELFEYALFKNGFALSNSGLWQYLEVKNFYTIDEYSETLKHSSRKILKKYSEIEARLNLIENDNLAEIRKAYELIQKNREKNGLTLKYSYKYLESIINLYPLKIFIFQLIVAGQMVAAAICHQTSPSILYVAAWGDANHNLKYSPMYIFAKYMIKYCLDKGISILDFGVSSDKYIYTPNLFSFKKNIGCKHCLQSTYLIR